MIFSPIENWKHELRDQLGHAFFAACLMAAFILPVPIWVSVLLVMTVALERELEQHEWDITAVGRRDLCVWLAASILFALIWWLSF